MPAASTCDTLKHVSGEIHTCDACIDTIELFFARIRPAEQLRRLKHCSSKALLTQCKGKNGLVWGYRLTVQQPSLIVLQKLDALVIEYQGIPTRLDVAITYFSGDLTQLKSDILRHCILRWRRAGAMRDYDDDLTYWCAFQQGKKRPHRNLTLYNKTIGTRECVRLELRLLRARVLRSNGIHGISDLIDLDPKALFTRHLKWSDVGDKFVQDVIRKAVQSDRKRTVKTPNTFTDRYRSRISHRVRDLLRRTGTDRAQFVRDHHPKRQVNSLPIPLSIPTSLTWMTSRRPHSPIATTTLHDTNSENIIL